MMNIEAITRAAHALADSMDAAVYLYNGAIDERGYAMLVGTMQASPDAPPRRNCILLLTTSGGMANAAYKIAKRLQMAHETFSIFVPSYCKSAGTLVALGCSALYMSDMSELGPLDVQQVQPDEIGRRKSGLVVRTAFEGLAAETLDVFEKIMLGIKVRSGGSVSFDTAARIATNIATGVMAPVYAQISPETLGNDMRDLNVASKYGELLIGGGGGNVSLEGVTQLVAGYPSHDFVIDRDEAKKLFCNVFRPTSEMEALENILGRLAYAEMESHAVFRLDTEGEGDDHDAGAGEPTESASGRSELDDHRKGESEGSAGDGGTGGSSREPADGETDAGEAS